MIQFLSALVLALAMTVGPAAYRVGTDGDTGATELPASGDDDTGDTPSGGVAGAASLAGEPGGCGCATGGAPASAMAGMLALATVFRRRGR